MTVKSKRATSRTVLNRVAKELWAKIDFKVVKQAVYFHLKEKRFKVAPADGKRSSEYMLDPDTYELFGVYWHPSSKKDLTQDLKVHFTEHHIDLAKMYRRTVWVGRP